MVVLAVLMSTGVAGAYPFVPNGPTLASTGSPFTGCPIGATDENSVNYPNTEPEPFVAVNPTNPLNVIGVYQQDRWSDGAAKGQGTAVSLDGGLSWAGHAFVPFSECAGGNPDYDRTSDPWVTFDPAGNAYQISLPVSADLETSAIAVSKSTDGGFTWDAPKTLIRDDTSLNFNDKESITADPTRPGYVYAVWDRGSFPSDKMAPIATFHSFAYRGQPMFSRTTNGGSSWSTPVGIADTNIFTIGNQIVVEPDGTLVDVFAQFRGSGVQPSPNQFFEAVMISKDAGRTWSQPIKISNVNLITLRDPDNGKLVRAGDYLPDVAVDRNTGDLYVVWADARFGDGTYLDVVMSKSSDGGRNWSAPKPVDTAPAGASAFNGTVEVTADGTVAVLWYDFRENDASPGLPTDVFLRHSHDGGATFVDTQKLAGPFDMEKAPVARGFFLGDYQGLAAAGNDLIAFFTTTDGDQANVYSVRLSPS
ncbi:MAG TPA: sialidase family protein [Actinomycetes bacterium]|nr:sialidase family protein [Actinomycetes bacterium]